MASLKILLLEPDKIIGQTLGGVLSAQGYQVVHTYSAQEAIIAADRQCPDLVICEIQLICHSGIEFLYEFRSYTDWQTTPVIIMSSVAPLEFMGSRQGLRKELGVEQYLYKPTTSIKQFIRAVDEILKMRINETA